jgi:hypothetical protein
MGYGVEWRHTSCVVCGKGFMDDCGDSVCSSSCERQYERDYAKCEKCGDEVGEDNLNDGVCETCEEDEE